MAAEHQAETAWERIDEELRREGVPVVLTLPAAAGIAGITPKALRALARAGVVDGSRSRTPNGRGRWRILRSSLSRFLAGASGTGGVR